ncbi:MAG TPA: DUF475 domain-containing protein [Sporichthyaceae bacterium]|jgi:hypothetical protein|nr:DUF475 domain-containing protein [Sporichthyaceae bacterium]
MGLMLRTFGWALATTVVALAVAGVLGGGNALALVAILIVLEISLSFDNAVVNAAVLGRLSAFWQKLFLSVGVVVAVFGMRVLFPLVIVGVTAHLGPAEAFRLARAGGSRDTPGTYANVLQAAHPQIAAFGGVFLLVLFLDFVLDPRRELHWLTWLEVPLARIGRLKQLPVVVAVVALVAVAEAFAEDVGKVMVAGSLGLVGYVLIHGLGELFEAQGHDRVTGGGGAQLVGRAAASLFCYLEVLDASFSLDGVIGAFAISQNIFVIAAGLGVGAMYIRSLTVFLVRSRTLGRYVFLEHGAMWAIGALSVILLVSIGHEAPDVATGLLGVCFIGGAFASSLARNRRREVPG